MRRNFRFLLCVSAILLSCVNANAERADGTLREQRLKEAGAHYAAGRELIDKENYSAADEEFKKAQEILNNLASPSSAESSGLTGGPEAGKTDPDIYYNLGIEYINAGEFRKAARALKKAFQLNPEDADACYNLGVLYEVYLGDKKQALDYYSRYINLAPESKDTEQVKLWIESSRKEAWGGR
jgi:tetratricopeptide (TPR) repeat protein